MFLYQCFWTRTALITKAVHIPHHMLAICFLFPNSHFPQLQKMSLIITPKFTVMFIIQHSIIHSNILDACKNDLFKHQRAHSGTLWTVCKIFQSINRIFIRSALSWRPSLEVGLSRKLGKLKMISLPAGFLIRAHIIMRGRKSVPQNVGSSFCRSIFAKLAYIISLLQPDLSGIGCLCP